MYTLKQIHARIKDRGINLQDRYNFIDELTETDVRDTFLEMCEAFGCDSECEPVDIKIGDDVQTADDVMAVMSDYKISIADRRNYVNQLLYEDMVSILKRVADIYPDKGVN